MIILYFTPLIMNGEKIAFKTILCNLWKKLISVSTAAKEINDVEGPGTVNECIAQNDFRRFKESDISLEDKIWSGRPSVAEDKALQCLNKIQEQALAHCWQNLVLHKATPINTSIILASVIYTKISKIQNCLKYCKVFDSLK